VPLVTVVGGRAAFAVLHTVLVLLLGAPFLAAAMAVGGAGIAHALSALAVIGSASLAARMCGLFFLALAGGRRPLRDLLLMPFLAASLVVTFLFAPQSSPFHALGSMLKEPGGPSRSLVCAALDLGGAIVLGGGAWAVLAGVRRRDQRRRAAGG
jgi:hypothetical protein